MQSLLGPCRQTPAGLEPRRQTPQLDPVITRSVDVCLHCCLFETEGFLILSCLNWKSTLSFVFFFVLFWFASGQRLSCVSGKDLGRRDCGLASWGVPSSRSAVPLPGGAGGTLPFLLLSLCSAHPPGGRPDWAPLQQQEAQMDIPVLPPCPSTG